MVDTAVIMKVWVVYGLASVLVWGSTEGGVLEHREERILHGRPLSDKHRDGEEEADYDHDAFLGDEDAEYFETLDPEESQRRLGIICDKIDKDKNGLISLEELQKWIQFVQEREVREDTDRQWEEKMKGKSRSRLSKLTHLLRWQRP